MRLVGKVKTLIKNNSILIITLIVLNTAVVLLGLWGNSIVLNEVYEKNREKGISKSAESVNLLNNIIYLGENAVNFVERDYRYIKLLPDNLVTTKILVDQTFDMINTNSDYFYNLYIACNGKVIGTSDEAYENVNPVGREWYDQAILKGELVITNPYEDLLINDKVITISKKVNDSDQCVVGLDIKQSVINSILDRMNNEEESIVSGYVLNREGVFVGHTNEELIGKSIYDKSLMGQEFIEPYIDDILRNDSGIVDFEQVGYKFSLLYQKTESDWHVVYIVDKAVMSTTTYDYSIRLMITYLISAILLNLIIIVYYVKRQRAICLQYRAEMAEKELRKYKDDLEIMVEIKTEEIEIQSEKLKELNTAIIDNLAHIVEFRDLESGQHIKRIKKFTYLLAKKAAEIYPEFKECEDKIDLICNASALHDIGKIGIPDSILLKPGKLTKEEFEEMKKHTIIGDDLALRILGKYDFELAILGHEICRYHHERYDGRGYPDGLKGDEIPACAQIVGIADVYDALRERRVYKEAYSHEKAIQMIMNGECGAFSPKLLHCLDLIELEFYRVSKEYE